MQQPQIKKTSLPSYLRVVGILFAVASALSGLAFGLNLLAGILTGDKANNGLATICTFLTAFFCLSGFAFFYALAFICEQLLEIKEKLQFDK